MHEEREKRMKEVKSGYADRLMRSRQFDAAARPDAVKNPRLYRFRGPDDEIEGAYIGGPFTNWRQSSSYVLEKAAGDQIEFFGNKQLHACMKEIKHGNWVRIRQIGWEKMPRGLRWRKVFRVWEIEGLGLLAPQTTLERTTGVRFDKVKRDLDEEE